jgi:DNA polymerase-3 subunit epsilon
VNFIAIDFETANSNRSSICSIGLAIVENGKLRDTEHIYVKPTPNYYDIYNVMVHGINENDTKNKRTFRQEWKNLRNYFHNQTIIAHNASFDCSALRFALDKGKLAYPNLNYHCTWRLSKELLPLRSFTLSDVSRHFRIKLKHHNAESDAKASALIALKLCEKFKAASLEELSTNCGFKVGSIFGETRTYKPFSKR